MKEPNEFIVITGVYGDAGQAILDFEEMQKLFADKEVGEYDAAQILKEPDGRLVVMNTDSTGRFKSAAKGALAGAVLSLAFPPGVLVMGALGAAAGGAIGPVKGHLKREDMKEIAELLNPGETGILLVTQSATDYAKDNLFPRAMRKRGLVVEGDVEAVKAAILQAAEIRDVGKMAEE